MKLIFIRHGDPDYEHDSLTEKGVREALLLSDRVKNWDITQVYCSPLGRAQKTASYSLEKLGRDAITYDWLREFNIPANHPTEGIKRTPWDYLPGYWTNFEEMYDKHNWQNCEIYKGTKVKEYFDTVSANLDNVLKEYGYVRTGNIYNTEKENDDTTLVFFCHLGISFALIGHLIGIAPDLMWHNFFVAPTSVSILCSEEREKGIANFRVQCIGDCSHLRNNNEPISSSGYYTKTFQG